jgi:hypothetical protein
MLCFCIFSVPLLDTSPDASIVILVLMHLWIRNALLMHTRKCWIDILIWTHHISFLCLPHCYMSNMIVQIYNLNKPKPHILLSKTLLLSKCGKYPGYVPTLVCPMFSPRVTKQYVIFLLLLVGLGPRASSCLLYDSHKCVKAWIQ